MTTGRGGGGKEVRQRRGGVGRGGVGGDGNARPKTCEGQNKKIPQDEEKQEEDK